MKKITGSVLVCAGAGLFAAAALLLNPTSSPPTSPNPAGAVPANAVAAAPPATAADGGPADGAGHGRHGAGSSGRSAAPSGATSAATVRISSFAFEATPVAPGVTVTVTNADQAPHTVTADDGSFATSVPAGATATFTAPDRAGTFTFFCEIHPQMTGTLVVR